MAHQHPLAVYQGVSDFEFLRPSLCESPSSLTMARAGSSRSHRLYERNRFALIATSQWSAGNLHKFDSYPPL